jgi:hypothetical protein
MFARKGGASMKTKAPKRTVWIGLNNCGGFCTHKFEGGFKYTRADAAKRKPLPKDIELGAKALLQWLNGPDSRVVRELLRRCEGDDDE